MPPLITKFAPQAIVLAVSLYWSWPALKTFFPQAAPGAPKVESKNSGGPHEFAATLLSPVFAPPTSRNPFLTASPQPTAVAGTAKPGQKRATVKKAADIRDAGLVLNATCIIGQQRMAVINGRVYKEKEIIPRPGDETTSCIVTDILPHKVLLSYQGKTLQLGYVNVVAKPTAGDDARKPAK